MFSQKPYTVKELGASSLRLLHSLHPVIHSKVGHLWNQAIPQLLNILEGKGLLRSREEWSRDGGQTPEEVESQGTGWTFLWVRETEISLSVPLRCCWTCLLIWVMLGTEQICSPEFCGSRIPRMTPAPSYGQRIREECGFWKQTDQFCILTLTLASCVCLTFGKSFIFWSPVKWESSYPVG